MSAVVRAPVLSWRPMSLEDVPAVCEMERQACLHPLHAWSEDNYRSCLSSGYWMRVALAPDGQLVAVCVALFGVGELHLLNIAVDKGWQGQGVAREALDALLTLCHAHGLSVIWLEVRPSNPRARCVYEAAGYQQVGLRPQYYPALSGREDAVVMKREVSA